MYIAELRGKVLPGISMAEDVLTSNVFSFFKYMPRDIFLKRFLSELGIEASNRELEEAVFRFWPQYRDNTEPDLVLIVGKHYILIECKYQSEFAIKTDKIEAQLIRESIMGMKEAVDLGLEFILLGLTADYYYPATKFKDIPEEHMNNVYWMNWQRICSMVFEILDENPPISQVERLFAEDFYQLLVMKRLRPYQGTASFRNLDSMKQYKGDLFFPVKARHYSGVFNGFEKALSGHNGTEFPEGGIFFKTHKLWQSLKDIHMNSELTNGIFYKGVGA